ncbi:MAG: hypothetical protein LBL79_02140 [Prevotella sp.]|jgi:hypothetical protein|nr:hypothetical protein [Prevotella sp.]
MKKLFLLGAFALVCLFSNAQGLQGTWFAGGSFAVQSDKMYAGEVEVKADTYTVMPLLGKFISPNVAIGGALGYSSTKAGDDKTNLFTVMPLARKYWNVTGGLYFFGQAALPVSFGNSKGNVERDVLGVSFALSPGFDLIVNSWLTVEASFGLASVGYNSSKPKGGKTNSSWGINGNTIGAAEFGDLSVGVKFLF